MLTPATITVNFDAYYAGPHRICWRQCNIGSYVCTNIVECVGGGNACSATISIMVDPESCTPMCFEGYIQATCNPEASSVDRIPWTVSFTPNPVCKPYRITCNSVDVDCTDIIPSKLGLNCDGTARPLVGPVKKNSSFVVCSTAPITTIPLGYSIIQDTNLCCRNCERYTITAAPNCPECTLDGSSIYYIDCTTRNLIRVDLSGTTPYTLTACMVIGSIYTYFTIRVSGTISLGTPCS